MTAPSVVAANIVTGFLGSGKTTLLRTALQDGVAGRKVAVIVNDFGDIAVDGVVLQGINVDRMVELPSGCVCCTVGSRFALAVQEIVDTVQPHLIVIETSGVAEPGPVISELALAGVKTDAVITVVDAETIARICRQSTAAVSQIEQADFIVVNKTDLVSVKTLVKVQRWLRRLNPRALQLRATYGDVEAKLLFATGVARYWCQPLTAPGRGEPGHLEADGISAFSFQRGGVMRRDRLEELLSTLPAEVYRAKGIVQFSGEGWVSLFNYTCGRFRVDWLAPTQAGGHDNRAVVIGRDLDRVRDRILRRLDECCESGNEGPDDECDQPL